jgi:hypothetical protein
MVGVIDATVVEEAALWPLWTSSALVFIAGVFCRILADVCGGDHTLAISALAVRFESMAQVTAVDGLVVRCAAVVWGEIDPTVMNDAPSMPLGASITDSSFLERCGRVFALFPGGDHAIVLPAPGS